MDTPKIYTIGHSNHPQDRFVELLKQHAIEMLIDVRSHPRSSYCPQYDRRTLSGALAGAGIEYRFLGEDLGGHPEVAEFYDPAGYVLYDRLARSAPFQGGISELQMLIQRQRVAVMCSEEDPAACHRHLLIARVLAEQGISVLHIRGDGTVNPDDSVTSRSEDDSDRQLKLFPEEPPPWRSIRSVSRRRRQASSLKL